MIRDPRSGLHATRSREDEMHVYDELEHILAWSASR